MERLAAALHHRGPPAPPARTSSAGSRLPATPHPHPDPPAGLPRPASVREMLNRHPYRSPTPGASPYPLSQHSGAEEVKGREVGSAKSLLRRLETIGAEQSQEQVHEGADPAAASYLEEGGGEGQGRSKPAVALFGLAKTFVRRRSVILEVAPSLVHQTLIGCRPGSHDDYIDPC